MTTNQGEVCFIIGKVIALLGWFAWPLVIIILPALFISAIASCWWSTTNEEDVRKMKRGIILGMTGLFIGWFAFLVVNSIEK